MKYLITILLLFIYTTEKKLKVIPCVSGLEKCKEHSDCCNSKFVCLRTKGHVCGTPRELGNTCGSDPECQSPNFCVDGRCTAPYESGHKCRKNYECASDKCKGNWGGYKNGVCA